MLRLDFLDLVEYPIVEQQEALVWLNELEKHFLQAAEELV
jgi:hypothetical protein